MATALITGASSGIGLELAKIHASKHDNLILVARNTNTLKELRLSLEKLFGIQVYIITADLSLDNAPFQIYEEVKNQNITVDYLINNAGFGDFGLFENTSWEKEKMMINLNISSLTQMTKLFLKDMIRQKSGRIMNVASTAAFQPGPTMSVYYATKSYVLHFSEAIDNEVRQHNISVTALCPGATESGFQAAASMEESKLVKGKKLPTSKEVATFGYEQMMKRNVVAIHGFKNRLMVFSLRLTPRSMVVKLVRKIQDASKR